MESSANGNGAKRADTAVARRTQSSFVTGTAASSGLGGTASSQSIDSIDEESKYSSNQSGVSAGPRGLERSSSALLPRWVPDKEAKKCRVCGTRFSFTVRRHHCRRCGQVVCGECSAQQVELSWEKKPARVCNQCFALHVAETPSRSGGAVDASSMSHPKASRSATVSGAALGAASPARTPVTRRQQTDGPQDPRDPRGSPSASESVLEPAAGVHAPHLSVKQQDVRMRQDTLPGWLYAFKPFSSAGESVGIGRVFVNVLAAENLPALDMLGTSDPYCIVRIKEEYDTYLENKAKDPAAPKPEEAVTSVVWKTLSPQWNEEFLLTVHNATHTLRVDLYDRDVGSADDPMGFVEIPLSTLSHQLRFDAWFDIQLTATKPDADSVALSAMKSGLKSVTDVFKLKEKDAKKDGADARLSKRRDTTPTTPVALSEGPRARLHLELHYTFSKVGEFFSHFHPKAPAPVPAEEFNVDKLYGQVMRLFAYLTPIFAVLGSISTVLSWEDPWTSGWVLFLFVSICVRPWLLPVLLQLLLIRYICSQYVHKKWLHAEKANKKLAVLKHSGSVEARVDEAAAITSPTSELTPANPNQPPPVADKANLNSVLRGTLNTSLAAAGWREWLQYYQNLLLWINDLLDTVANLFTWRHQATTKAILIALVITTLYSIFLSFSHILMIAGVYVLTSFTVPVQFLTWLVWGLVGYFSRKKVSKKTVRVSKKNV